MDQDDPEQRIAELERQLADQKSTDETKQRPALTAADIQYVAFGRPPIGKRGYNEDEVDAFLQRVEARLLNPSDPSLTAIDVQNVAFSKPPIGKRGYNEDEVDAFVDRVASEISRLDGAAAYPVGGQRRARQMPPVIASDMLTRRRGLRSIGVGVWLTVFLVGFWLYWFGDLAWDFYGYQVGTPATATDISCLGSRLGASDDANQRCSGTWSVGGQSRHGAIERVPSSWKSGQSLDVHAHGDTAYAAGSTGWPLSLSMLVGGLVIVMSLGGFQALNRRWRQWRRRQLP
jgi:DivIVA domain-containing protein